MRVMDLIGSTLLRVTGLSMVAVSLSGCGCPDAEGFEVDEEITADVIDRILAQEYDGSTNVDVVTCEDVCRNSFVVDSIDSCTFEIDGYVPPPEMPAASDTDAGSSSTSGAMTPRWEMVVGNIQCTGQYTPECIGGRRPLGHVAAQLDEDDPLGRSLAAFAHLEAASVTAFLQLKQQLQRWGAPTDLLERCEAAARDEVEHARVLTELAQERGASVPRPRLGHADAGLLAAAIHNATEGCVSETWSALLAHHQASAAHDPRHRLAYATIAVDETRHGQLAWDLHAWFMRQLSDADRRQVLSAQAQAIAALPRVARSQARTMPPELGLPEATRAEQLAEAFAAAIAA